MHVGRSTFTISSSHNVVTTVTWSVRHLSCVARVCYWLRRQSIVCVPVCLSGCLSGCLVPPHYYNTPPLAFGVNAAAGMLAIIIVVVGCAAMVAPPPPQGAPTLPVTLADWRADRKGLQEIDCTQQGVSGQRPAASSAMACAHPTALGV
jgi:hypothetical protein